VTCFLVARYTVLDETVTAEYSELAAPMMAAYGGKIIFRGKSDDRLAGQENYENAVVATFPSKTHALNWYNSSDYQRIIPLRQRGVEITITVYE
jgi:uncharacterized protein (DUF1330 family)